MNDLTTPGGRTALVDRIKGILLKPADEWPKIAAESATPGDLITRYAVPLAAIRPLASFIGGQLFGFSALFVTVRPSFLGGLTDAIRDYVVALVGVIALGLIADALAPKFGGTANRTNAFKLAVYGMTAAWVAGIAFLIPGLRILALAGLYSIYLIYLGVGPLMAVPEDKRAGFTAVTLVATAVVMVITMTVANALTGGLAAGGILASRDSSAEVSIPGVGTIDTAKIEAAGKQMESIGNGDVKVVAGSDMQALLPPNINGYARTAVSTGSVGRMGSEAEGTYTAGDKSFRLKLTDMAALGALAGIGGALGVEQSREDANGYERTTTVDGQIQTEEWNKTDSRGKFGTMVGGRFMIAAEGQAGSIDELKAAVAMIDPGSLAALAK